MPHDDDASSTGAASGARQASAGSSEDSVPEADVSKPSAASKLSAGLKRRPALRIALILLLLIGIVAALIWYVNYREHGRYLQTTNDAYIKADFVTISPKVGGYVEQVLVVDNQMVRRGQVLLRLDQRDYGASVDQSRAQISEAQAAITGALAGMDEQRAAIAQAASQLTAARVAAAFAEANVRRYAPLAASGAESDERYDNLRLERDRTIANVRTQEAVLLGARRRILTQRAQTDQARARLKAADAQLARARTDLGAVEIRSSIDGVVGDKSVRVGQYVQPATRLMSIVPIAEIYVEANFKETQIGLMRIGQPAVVTVDALDGAELRGKIVSFSPGTGSQFSLLPPENATGNFTKIVQRVPVRIRIEAGPEARAVMRPGLSVHVTVDTRSAKDAQQRISHENERLTKANGE